MKRFELSLSPKYVPNWTVFDAIREIFQNALDQEKSNPENKMSFCFDSSKQQLTISNRKAKLDVSTLLLGNTNKQENEELIGSFGEGYKLAILVLIRSGYPVIIYNKQAREIWRPKIIKSRRYNSDLLVIDIETFLFSDKESNLDFNISGLSSNDLKIISELNLHFLSTKYNKINTTKGEILTDKDMKGKLFINGLFLTNDSCHELTYGYNIEPKYIKTNRDRTTVNTFDIQYLTSSMWADVTKTNKKELLKLLTQDACDTKYLYCHNKDIVFNEDIYEQFKLKYGPQAIPAVNQEEVEKLRVLLPMSIPIISNKTVTVSIRSSSSYTKYSSSSILTDYEKTPYTLLDELFRIIKSELSYENKQLYNQVLVYSKEWGKLKNET
jgi:hypothetical protein